MTLELIGEVVIPDTVRSVKVLPFTVILMSGCRHIMPADDLHRLVEPMGYITKV